MPARLLSSHHERSVISLEQIASPPSSIANSSATETPGQIDNEHPHRHASASHPCDKHSVGWRRIVRNFTPSWFAVNMGTGIVSILLLRGLPYTTLAFSYLAYAFFALNVALFLVFLALSIARYSLYPEIWVAMVNHPGQSLFLGTFPMGLASKSKPLLNHTESRLGGRRIVRHGRFAQVDVHACASNGIRAACMA
ncbi:voltage-dependent anion channel-domain-containing protein [Coniella lustricola]|uniref:Voltage-dependent anion channel-domain-containing protein n=1 Tax=Coniella lustricola TaxID=2025994 RepID=A0A2T2ZVR5_9PEZI|nr:voltage-dependent anion channel-domain-containing protein [Coniella lustricola]